MKLLKPRWQMMAQGLDVSSIIEQLQEKRVPREVRKRTTGQEVPDEPILEEVLDEKADPSST